MLQPYKRNTNIGVGIGWVVLILSRIVSRSELPAHGLLGIALFLAGGVLFLWGCVQYAKAKGHSGYWGALGLLSIVGLIVLFFLPDKNKDAASA